MKPVMLGSLITLMLALFGPSTYACWCTVGDVGEGVERAKFVFVGEVTQIVPPTTDDENARLQGRFYIIVFHVEKIWKGEVSNEMRVLSAQGKYGCLAYPEVRKGERYLVYADPPYNNGKIQSEWSIITSCNRTARLPKATQPTVNRFNRTEVNRMDGSADLETLEKMKFLQTKNRRI